MSDKTVYQKLTERFATEDHAKVNKGGGDQTYVPAERVISRLNEALGVDGWSFRALREGFTAHEAWVLGQLTATVDGAEVIREQYGNEPIVMGQRERPTTDLLKKAGTDALKKCATLIGVGLYLYDADERHEVEAEMREASKPEAKAPAKPVSQPTGNEKARAAAMVGGANSETIQARWRRLVAEAERVKLPTLPQVKAIAVNSISAAQLTSYAGRLEKRLQEHEQTESGAA